LVLVPILSKNDTRQEDLSNADLGYVALHLYEVPRMYKFIQAAITDAQLGLAESGIPIGSVLVHKGVIIGRGHCLR
jgi:hypothetical protein